MLICVEPAKQHEPRILILCGCATIYIYALRQNGQHLRGLRVEYGHGNQSLRLKREPLIYGLMMANTGLQLAGIEHASYILS